MKNPLYALAAMGIGLVPGQCKPGPDPANPPTAKIAPRNQSGYYVSAQTSCPSAVTLINSDINPHTFLIHYGPRQTQLHHSVVAGAETVVVDLQPAAGERATLFVDGGAMWNFTDIGC